MTSDSFITHSLEDIPLPPPAEVTIVLIRHRIATWSPAFRPPTRPPTAGEEQVPSDDEAREAVRWLWETVGRAKVTATADGKVSQWYEMENAVIDAYRAVDLLQRRPRDAHHRDLTWYVTHRYIEHAHDIWSDHFADRTSRPAM
ncbi:hypothetical protein OG453_23675 [Streptomyces sp. NBC_01381]|uniref:hypothetical protein n=1 Tax=Streptomyces sp. NBC_01381 TaxID=2903845 RepID=UPI0022594114|nr:hypothetical protein [Streptomyces sp. NBC_01381]MCX4669647.1 hypothetical protein [Streptomyces sp. NBC_01381]